VGARSLLVLAEPVACRARVSSPRMRARRAEPGARLQRVEPACLSGRRGAELSTSTRTNAFRHRSAARRVEAADPAELGLLREAARLDPRRRIGAWRSAPSGRSVSARDARAEGSLGQRRRDASTFDRGAWSLPTVYSTGGANELVTSPKRVRRFPSVAELVRARKDGAEAKLGRAVLVEIAKQGTTDERSSRCSSFPLDAADTVAALDEGAKRRSGVCASRHWLGCSTSGAPPRGPCRLETAARTPDGAARQAHLALASGRTPPWCPLLEHDVSDRTVAAGQCRGGTVSPGASSKNGGSAADSDPGVRMRVACSVAGPRSGAAEAHQARPSNRGYIRRREDPMTASVEFWIDLVDPLGP